MLANSDLMLSQLGDSSIEFGFMNQEKFETLLKLNLLFSERIATQAAGLLANPFSLKLFGADTADPSAAGIVRSGLLRPVIEGYGLNLIDLARLIAENRTRISLATQDQLFEHARLLHELNPTPIYIDHAVFRANLKDMMCDLFGRYATDGFDAGTVRFKPGDLDVLAQWINSLGSRVFTVTQLYDFIESIGAPTNEASAVKLTAHAAYVESMRQLSGGRLSSSSEYVPHLQAIRRCKSPNDDRPDDPLSVRDYPVDFDMSQVRSTTFSEIVSLRQAAPFLTVRQHLHSSRINGEKLAREINQCQSVLNDYSKLRSSEKPSRIKEFRDKARMHTVLRVGGYSWATGATFVGLTCYPLGSPQGYALLLAAIGASVATLRNEIARYPTLNSISGDSRFFVGDGNIINQK